MIGISLPGSLIECHDSAESAHPESSIRTTQSLARRSTVSGYCFALPYEEGDGPANMARDEALLNWLPKHAVGAYVRTYGWSVPTLSIGYFQRLAEARAEDRWRSVPLVRRASGGGAIWHDHELTYAVALWAGHPLARHKTGLYRTVHAAIAEVLREQGLTADRRGEVEGESAATNVVDSRVRRPFLCFSDGDPEDLVSGGFKVVGSAQRRRAGGILQHGSILLRTAERTPEHRGICDLTMASSDPLDWSSRVQARIAQALDLVLVPSDPPADLCRQSREIERLIYRQAAWADRR
jgi:lipoate-protein ligase A